MRQKRIYNNLRTRAEIIRLIRRFFFENDYLEVETPSRIPSPIPEAHIEPVESDGWCLHASPEICMKQLLAAGYDKIYQIARVFRKHERGRKHLPELTMLEWYTKGDTYLELMVQLEELILYICRNLKNTSRIEYLGYNIEAGDGFERLSVENAFKKYATISMEQALSGNSFDEIMGLSIEPELGFDTPVYLYNYPAEKGSLAKLKESDERYAERFELYIAGLELCNGFSELNDPVEQKERFYAEQEIRKENGCRLYPLPEVFINALSILPDCAGIAVGIDRLVMLFTGAESIDDVVAFTPEDLETP